MSVSIDNMATIVFKVLKGAGKSVKVYGEQGETVVDPKDGRRFFASPENLMVEVSEINSEIEVTMYLSSSVDQSDASVQKIANTLKSISSKNKADFNQTIFGHEITPKDHAFKIDKETNNESHRRATMADTLEEGNTPAMTGSSKRSIQKWNEARLVIKHTKPVNEEARGSRTRNISKIFIETTEGERFKFPNNHLASARAMARHVGAGGTFHDSAGSHIIGLSEEFNAMGKVSTHVQRNRSTLSETAITIRNTVRSRMKNIRESLNQFMTISGYKAKLDEVENMEATPLNEETLAETLELIRSELNVSEDNTKMLAALGHVAVLEDIATTIYNRSQNAHKDVTDYFDAGNDPEDKRSMNVGAVQHKDQKAENLAAAELLHSGNFVFVKPMPADIKSKAEQQHTPASMLTWRIGALSARLAPDSEQEGIIGQDVLANILSDIHQKLVNVPDAAMVAGSNLAQAAGLSSGEQQIAQIFLKQAKKIGECITEAGYNDWALVSKKAPVYEEKEKTEEVDEVEEASTYVEATQLDEWFESFDPDKLLEDSIPLTEGCGCGCGCSEDSPCECGPECECGCNAVTESEDAEENVKETEVQKMMNKGLIEDVAYKLAERIANGERTLAEAVQYFEEAEYESIVSSLKENFRNAEELLEAQEGDNRRSFKEEKLDEFIGKGKTVVNKIKGKILSQDTKDRILSLFANGKTLGQVAHMFNMEDREFMHILQGAGIEETVIPFDKGKSFRDEITVGPKAKSKKGKRNAKTIRTTKDELDAEEYFF